MRRILDEDAPAVRDSSGWAAGSNLMFKEATLGHAGRIEKSLAALGLNCNIALKSVKRCNVYDKRDSPELKKRKGDLLDEMYPSILFDLITAPEKSASSFNRRAACPPPPYNAPAVYGKIDTFANRPRLLRLAIHQRHTGILRRLLCRLRLVRLLISQLPEWLVRLLAGKLLLIEPAGLLSMLSLLLSLPHLVPPRGSLDLLASKLLCTVPVRLLHLASVPTTLGHPLNCPSNEMFPSVLDG
ncbi:hypothetical protein CABS01_01746 [Colletotrichum abscissum]|uniref:Uncharacterized protein n=1 Tax=Colletotrichum abscissum TaxID=1671311 RepID=A0A9Q0AYJ0_9PEZI|nr:uncharacterized protein CABS01_01746 [Colletotrichum abscissum]KAI3535748.1 hypothetical protein CABS02_12794 [Colletotrichum abscissum]KAK1495939.1 hypothetical protein CABS01_01746 [Colletotrichum abscissum]